MTSLIETASFIELFETASSYQMIVATIPRSRVQEYYQPRQSPASVSPSLITGPHLHCPDQRLEIYGFFMLHSLSVVILMSGGLLTNLFMPTSLPFAIGWFGLKRAGHDNTSPCDQYIYIV